MTHCTGKEREVVLSYLESRFGLQPSLFSSFQFTLSAKGRVFLGPLVPESVSPLSVGIGIARLSPSGAVKPSTAFLQLFGRHITKGKIELSREQAAIYLSGESFPLNTKAEEGYVLLTYNNQPLGCGLLKSSAASGREGNQAHPRDATLKNMLPKARRQVVQFM